MNEATELPDDLEGIVGVTAGASAPDRLVEEVIAKLAPRNGVEVMAVTLEDEYFPPPPELRELLRRLDDRYAEELGEDRDVSAASVLDSLVAEQ